MCDPDLFPSAEFALLLMFRFLAMLISSRSTVVATVKRGEDRRASFHTGEKIDVDDALDCWQLADLIRMQQAVHRSAM